MSIRRLGWPTSWPASPSIRPATSMNCCRGIGAHTRRHTVRRPDYGADQRRPAGIIYPAVLTACLRLFHCFMDINSASSPGMPGIKNFALVRLVGPVGVPFSSCTTPFTRIPVWSTDHSANTPFSQPVACPVCYALFHKNQGSRREYRYDHCLIFLQP